LRLYRILLSIDYSVSAINSFAGVVLCISLMWVSIPQTTVW
jgi:hypothetical protein